MKTHIFFEQLPRRMVLSLLLWIPATLVQAKDIYVCPVSCDYTAINDAINAASSGDTIVLDNGVYKVNVQIAKNITITGQGSGQTILDGGGKATYKSVVTVFAGYTVKLQGLGIRSGFTDTTGGGIVNAGTLTLENCDIYSNTAGLYGGGIWNNGTLLVSLSSIHDNYSFNSAGAIWNENYTQILKSAIFNNNSLVSGAIVNAGVKTNFNIGNSTLSGNGGGAITNYGGGVKLESTTVAKGNVINGVASSMIESTSGLLWISRSIISAPTTTASCILNGTPAPTIISSGGNLTSDATCNLTNPTDQQNISATSLALAPLAFHPLDLTPTHALLPGSVAVDAITQSSCFSANLVDDQRGFTRPQGSGCDSGAFELQVPTAKDDSFTTTQGTKLDTFAGALPGVLENDVSPEGLPLFVDYFTTAQHGSVFIDAAGHLSYWPNPDFIGQDSFTYTISDDAHTSTATVTINVQAVNHPPVVQNDSYSVFADQTLEVIPANGVLANDSDPDGNPMTAVTDTYTQHGTLTPKYDGSFFYTPEPGFIGTDSFTYKASDGQVLSGIATVTIDVKPYLSTITIIEDAQPDSPANFKFTGDLGKFVLDNPATDDGDVYGNSKTFNVKPGTYTISQIKAAGWFTGSISCNPVANTIADLNLNNIQVTVNGGENITCTFVNQRPGRLSVKVFNDLNRNQRRNVGEPWLANWEIQLYVYSPSETPLSQWTNATGQAVFSNLKPGNYTVCEVLQPNWNNLTPLGLDLIFGAPCYPIQVKPGQTTSVLFGNTSVP